MWFTDYLASELTRNVLFLEVEEAGLWGGEKARAGSASGKEKLYERNTDSAQMYLGQ